MKRPIKGKQSIITDDNNNNNDVDDDNIDDNEVGAPLNDSVVEGGEL